MFVRQRRIDVIQRALSVVLDDESWSPATPRRLYVGAADASSRGWTMIVPELANFFLDRGGLAEPRLCRLARELRCPAYEVDARERAPTTLYEVDEHGAIAVSSPVVGFALVPVGDDLRDRVAALAAARSTELADYLGAVAGFPGWTRYADDPITAGELIYEPARILASTTARLTALSGTREAIARSAPRGGPSFDRRGRRPRSVSRPRR